MSDLDQDTINSPSRRGLIARVAGAAAIGIAGLTAKSVRAATAADGPNWRGNWRDNIARWSTPMTSMAVSRWRSLGRS
jgi:hypothetical protein